MNKCSKIFLDSSLLILLMILMGSISICLKNINLWDFENYHFYNAYAFLNNRLSYDIAPAQLQTYFNPLLDTFNYFIIKTLVNPNYIEFVFGALNGVTAFFAIKIAYYVFDSEPKELLLFSVICSILISFTSPCFIEQIGISFTDAETSTLTIASIYYCIRYVNSDINQSLFLILSAGLIGIAVGLKLVNACYLIGILIALNFSIKTGKRNPLLLFTFTSISFFLLTEGFWMWKLYENFKNPFFPIYNQYFQSPYASIKSYVDYRYMPKNISQWLFYPFYWIETNHLINDNDIMRDWRPALAILLGLIYLIRSYFCKNIPSIRHKAFIYLIVFCLTSYILWLKEFSIYRYFLPISLILGILIIRLFLINLNNLQYAYRKILITALTMSLILSSILPLTFDNYKIYKPLNINVPIIPDNSIVILINGSEPFSYLIPYFPNNSRFISLFNFEFYIIGDNNKLIQTSKEVIKSNQNKLYVIDNHLSDTKKMINRVLTYYKLQEIPKSCKPIYSTLPPFIYQLCQVIPMEHPHF
jgi:hypothetical protein